MRRLSLILLLVLAAALVSCSYENSVNKSLQPYLEFTSNGDGSASVMLKAGFEVGELAIPAYVDLGSGTLEVTVFKGCEDEKGASSVRRIVLPETLDSYDEHAFENMSALEDVRFSGSIPETLTWDGILARTIEREGFDFDGWQSGDHMIQPGDRICDYPAVFPVFSGRTYQIDYHLDGGILPEGSITSFKSEPDTPVSVSLPVPTRDGYTFSGWFLDETFKTAIDTITSASDTSVYARWSINSYTVRFLNYDGSVLATRTVEYGCAVPYSEISTPVKPSDAQYGYEFTGWNPAGITAVTGDTDVTAVFNAVENSYTVVFANYDGSELQTRTLVYGSTPVYEGATPAKPQSAEYTYEFSGWDKTVAVVTEDATYTALYTELPRTYSVTLNANEGSIAEGKAVSQYTFGTGAALPSAADMTRSSHKFAGWFSDSTFSGSAVQAIGAAETGDKEFFAKWIKHEGVEAWTCDETNHWHICCEAGCDEIHDKAAHVWSEDYCSNSDKHWKVCTICGAKQESLHGDHVIVYRYDESTQTLTVTEECPDCAYDFSSIGTGSSSTFRVTIADGLDVTYCGNVKCAVSIDYDGTWTTEKWYVNNVYQESIAESFVFNIQTCGSYDIKCELFDAESQLVAICVARTSI